MQHLAANISKEIGRIREWSGTLWHRRYDAIVVSDEPEAQWQRLRYVLSHGAKEGLVESPLDWPGVHAAKPLIHGEPLAGTWFNRSKEWAARNRGLNVSPADFAPTTRSTWHLYPPSATWVRKSAAVKSPRWSARSNLKSERSETALRWLASRRF